MMKIYNNNKGINRFKRINEIKNTKLFRELTVDYSNFINDKNSRRKHFSFQNRQYFG